jgi:hypothetical protein
VAQGMITKRHVRIVGSFLVLASLLTISTQSLAHFEPEQDLSHPMVQKAIQENNGVYDRKEIAKAFDSASAAWMQFFGKDEFLRARGPVDVAVSAMRASGWLPHSTDIVISMLDARGDFAWAEDGRCTVHVNIDHRGSSPVIAALGNFASSISFIAAHEMAHCWFDELSTAEKYPTKGLLSRAGVPRALQDTFFEGFQHPNETNGTTHLVDSYDEALADATTAIALRKYERMGMRFGSALENAQSMRLGELSIAKRHGVAATDHQGGFVFDAIAKLPFSNLDWFHARSVALQSVLASSFYTGQWPKWAKEMGAARPARVKRLSRKWNAFAVEKLKERNLKSDEDRYLSATDAAIFTFNESSVGTPDLQGDIVEWERLWAQVAWQSSDAQASAQSPSPQMFNSRHHLQAVVKRRTAHFPGIK